MFYDRWGGLCCFGQGELIPPLLQSTHCLHVAVQMKAASSRLGYIIAIGLFVNLSMTKLKQLKKAKKNTYYIQQAKENQYKHYPSAKTHCRFIIPEKGLQKGQRSKTKSSNLCCAKSSIMQCLAPLTERFYWTSCPVANPANSNQPGRETNSDPWYRHTFHELWE